jgi:hypothetical protein
LVFSNIELNGIRQQIREIVDAGRRAVAQSVEEAEAD